MNNPEKTQKPPGRAQRLRYWLVNIGMILAAYFIIQAVQTRDAPTQGPAPAFSGQLLDGTPVSLEQYQGQALLLHFWATWCTICRIEQGSINNIAKDYPVIAVASQSGSVEQVRKVVRERGITVPVLVDEYGALSSLYGIKAFPTSFVIDAQGQIHDVEVGYTSELGLRARLKLAGG